MSTIPIVLVNQILDISAQLKNAKYVPSVSQSGNLEWKFNLESKGNQDISQLYDSRIGRVPEPINVFIHHNNFSYPYSGHLRVLRVYENKNEQQFYANVIIMLETISHKHIYLLADVKLIYGLDQPISRAFDVMQCPIKGTYYYYDIGKKEYTWGSIATMVFKMYGQANASNEWLDVKIYSENGYWKHSLDPNQPDQYIILNDDLDEMTELDEVEMNEEWNENWDGVWEPMDVNQIPQLEIHT